MAEHKGRDLEEEGGDAGDGKAKRLAELCDAFLPLLTFLVDRQDSTSLVTMLVLVLILRVLAGLLGGGQS